MQNQILTKNLQGNVSQLEGRINNQILGVKGLSSQVMMGRYTCSDRWNIARISSYDY